MKSEMEIVASHEVRVANHSNYVPMSLNLGIMEMYL